VPFPAKQEESANSVAFPEAQRPPWTKWGHRSLKLGTPICCDKSSFGCGKPSIGRGKPSIGCDNRLVGCGKGLVGRSKGLELFNK